MWVQVPPFPIKYHLTEFKFRVFYITLSIFITFILALIFSDFIYWILMPNFNTFVIINKPVQAWLLKIEVSVLWTIISNIIFSFLIGLYLFIRPGLYKKEDINLSGICWFYFSPWIFYFFFIDFLVPYFLLSTTMYYKYIPTYDEIINLIYKFIILAIIGSILIIILIKYYKEEWIKYRKYVLFGLVLMTSVISPPDIIYLIIEYILLFIMVELYYFINILCRIWTGATVVKGQPPDH